MRRYVPVQPTMADGLTISTCTVSELATRSLGIVVDVCWKEEDMETLADDQDIVAFRKYVG